MMPKKLTNQEFIEKARAVHGNKYDYSKVNYVNNKIKVEIICPEHGSFLQTPAAHLIGNGCRKCANEKKSEKNRIPYDILIKELKQIHDNKYLYPKKNKKNYKNGRNKIYIVCPTHGEFRQEIYAHKNSKKGCPKCGFEKMAEKQKIPYDILIEELKQIHNNKYLYPEKNRKIYKNNNNKIYIVCPTHGEFTQLVKNHKYLKQGCPKCPITISKPERELADFIFSLGHEIIQSYRGWCPERPQLEIDIYIPSLNIGFEFNGLYWHSLRDKDYHKEKTLLAHINNIKLIHIWEDKWKNNPESVKGMIEKRIENA